MTLKMANVGEIDQIISKIFDKKQGNSGFKQSNLVCYVRDCYY